MTSLVQPKNFNYQFDVADAWGTFNGTIDKLKRNNTTQQLDVYEGNNGLNDKERKYANSPRVFKNEKPKSDVARVSAQIDADFDKKTDDGTFISVSIDGKIHDYYVFESSQVEYYTSSYLNDINKDGSNEFVFNPYDLSKGQLADFLIKEYLRIKGKSNIDPGKMFIVYEGKEI